MSIFLPCIAPAIIAAPLNRIGFWPLNERSGTTAKDYSGNGFDGTTGSPAPHWMIRGGHRCADVNSEARINLPSGVSALYQDPLGGTGTGAVTMTAWIYIDTLPNTYNGFLGTKRDTGYATGCDFYVKSNGKLAVYVSLSGAPDTMIDGDGTYTLAAGQWYFVAMNAGGSLGVNTYVNGLLDRHHTPTAPLFTVAPAIPMSIGRQYTYDGNYFDGGIRDVSIFNRQLTAAEILTLYAKGPSGTSFSLTDIPGLVFWIDASDPVTVHTTGGAVTQVDDQSTTGYHVTDSGNSTLRPTYLTAAQHGLNVLDFNGSANRLNNGASPGLLQAVSGWTLVCVCKPDVNNVDQAALFVQAFTGVTGRAVIMPTRVTTGYARAYGRRLDADSSAIADSTTQTTTSDYTVFVAAASYTNTRLKLYANGTEIASNTSWSTSGTTSNDPGMVVIGARGDDGANDMHFDGKIAVCAVYNSELSSTDIARVTTALMTQWGL